MMAQVRNHKPLTPAQAAARPGPLDALLDPELFRSLCDPTRSRLLACLIKCSRPCSVSEVADCCSVDLSVVSRHLQLLARTGILESSKQGRGVSYRVRFDHVCGTLRELADAIEQCQSPGPCCKPNRPSRRRSP